MVLGCEPKIECDVRRMLCRLRKKGTEIGEINTRQRDQELSGFGAHVLVRSSNKGGLGVTFERQV